MGLSSELISQLAKIAASDTSPKTDTTLNGTTVHYNGKLYVKLDGSDLLTPVNTTVDVKDDERVTVSIKNHTATVTGNTSSPAARTDDVKDAANKISEFEIIVSHKVTADELEAINATIDSLSAKTANIENIEALKADINNLKAKYASLEYIDANDITAINADIESLEAKFAEITDLSAEELEAINADITNLKAYNADFTYVSTDVLEAIKASIKELEVKKLSAEQADIKYANIDFSNIGEAAVKKLFADSGIIKDLVVSEGKITGELVGVTIKGDLIEGGTVVADKLVVKGEDGLYYKLNTDGVTTEAEQTEYNSLNGSVITAKSITATKIAVTDLVAFDATIGGFHITENAIYSGVKESAENTTQGIYLDKTGQMSLGDQTNFLQYYKDSEGNWKLELTANSIKFGTSGKSVETAFEELDDAIKMLVTDENGESLMIQNGTGWTFNMGAIQSIIDKSTEDIDSLQGDVTDVRNLANKTEQLANDLAEKTAYINMTTDETGAPCIELGKEGNEFKVRITNTAIDFLQGTEKIAYITNSSLYIQSSVVTDELKIGDDEGFVWKKRGNGNMGLRWFG